jgi:hypothetical protein
VVQLVGVKIKTKTDKIPVIQHQADSLKGKSVQIGALNGSHAWLAGIHEYG